MRHTTPVRIGVAAAAVFAAALALAAPASAGTRHTIVTADSPSTGAPVIGGGSWIVNKPDGYYIGRAMPGTTFDDEVATAANWHYGRADNPDMCGWVLPGSMGATVDSVADSCSSDTDSALSHRMTVGKDYNAPAHGATDGTASPADACTLYYNYFNGTDFAGGANGGHWANPAGTVSGSVAYRFTTLDGQAAVVRDSALGWGFVPVGCVSRPSPLYDDND
jgi:hypothetical protein